MRTRLVDLLLDRGRKSEAAHHLNELAILAEARADTKTTTWAMIKACEIEPENLAHHRRLAEFQERTGDPEAARRTRLNMIRLMLKSGMMEDARILAERIVESMIEDHALRMEVAEMFEQAGLPEVSAYHFHQLARRSLESVQYEEAKVLARRALELKPRHIGARETLIESMLAQRELKEAVNEYERLYEIHEEDNEWDAALRTVQAIIDLAPSQPEPRGKLIRLYRKMHREEAMIDQLRRLTELYVNANDLDSAIRCLRELMNERPDDTQARIRYIDLYSQIGDESGLAEDYLQLARISARKGSLVEATRAYEKMIALLPDEPESREEFVQFLFEQGQISRAVEETRLLADILEATRRDQQAIRMLDRALNYAPQELELRQRLAAVYMRTNRRGMAMETFRTLARHYEQTENELQLIEVIEKIVQIDGMNVEFRQRLADLYYHKGLFDQAMEQFGLLADQYVERGLYDLAEHEYRSMLEIRPKDSELWRRMAEVHMQIGTAREIVPDLLMLASLYTEQGRLKDAVGVYRRILDCEPDNLDALTQYIDGYIQIGLEQDLVDEYLRLADLKVKRGETAESIRIFKHLIELAPDHPVVQERLTETQQVMAASRSSKENGRQAHPSPELRIAGLAGEDELPKASPALMKVIRNYENVLRLNPNNPTAHVKLAELFEQIGDLARADSEWALAAESLFSMGNLDQCIAISERYLERHPEDACFRERLARALLQRDSLRAIDKALIAGQADLD